MIARPLTLSLSSLDHQDNTTIYSGGADNVVKMWNVTQGAASAQSLGRHDAPVK